LEFTPRRLRDSRSGAIARYTYSLLVFSAVAWAFKAPFADLSGAAAGVILLIAALHKSWVATLFIASRRRKDASG
jgi:hypothetical protein